MTSGMSDTDVYRILYRYLCSDSETLSDWHVLVTRGNGFGFYPRLFSARNAIKQIKGYTTETKIQKLVAYHPTDSASDLIWEDIDA